MCRILCALFLVVLAATNAFAATDGARTGAMPPACESATALSVEALPLQPPSIQLAQSGCRSDCSSRRSYCLSSCDGRSQCRAICNDNYQSCVSGCR